MFYVRCTIVFFGFLATYFGLAERKNSTEAGHYTDRCTKDPTWIGDRGIQHQDCEAAIWLLYRGDLKKYGTSKLQFHAATLKPTPIPGVPSRQLPIEYEYGQ